MTPALAEIIERLKQMSPERQEAFARLIMREIVADEQWMRSAAQAAEWQRKQKEQEQPGSTAAQAKPRPPLPPQRANEVVPFS